MKTYKSRLLTRLVLWLVHLCFLVAVLRWLSQNSRRHRYQRPGTECQWTLVPVINSNNSESHGGTAVQCLALWPPLLGAGGFSASVRGLYVLLAQLLSTGYLTWGTLGYFEVAVGGNVSLKMFWWACKLPTVYPTTWRQLGPPPWI